MIFFFYGQDSFRARTTIDALRQKFIAKVDTTGHALYTLEGDDFDWDHFWQLVRTPGLLSQKNFLLVKNIFDNDDFKNQEKALQQWLGTLDDSANEHYVVFWHQGDAPKKALAKDLKKFKYVQEFASLEPLQAQQWVIELINQAGRSMTTEAVQLLIASVGPDSWQLHHEVQKLIHGTTGVIDHHHVASLVNAKMQDKIFELIDGIAAGNSSRAQELVAEALGQGVEPLYLMGMINRQMRLLVQASGIATTTRNSYAIAEALGVHPYVGKKLLSQVSRWRPDRFPRLYQTLLAADRRLKFSQDPESTLAIMIEQLQK